MRTNILSTHRHSNKYKVALLSLRNIKTSLPWPTTSICITVCIWFNTYQPPTQTGNGVSLPCPRIVSHTTTYNRRHKRKSRTLYFYDRPIICYCLVWNIVKWCKLIGASGSPLHGHHSMTSIDKVTCRWFEHSGKNTHRGARTHDHQVKSLTLYRLS